MSNPWNRGPDGRFDPSGYRSNLPPEHPIRDGIIGWMIVAVVGTIAGVAIARIIR